MTPHRGKYWSLLFLQGTPLFQFWTLEGLFELTRSPSRALNLTFCFASVILEIPTNDRCAAEATGHLHEQLMLTLMVKITFYNDPWL